MKHPRANRQVTELAAKELARMLYEDEKRKRQFSENAMKRRILQEALDNLNTWGWVECPYTHQYVQTDPKKAETKIINGSLFWINECDGRKVYVNVFLKPYVSEEGVQSYMTDVRYMTEDEFHNWLNGKPPQSVSEDASQLEHNDEKKID